MEELTMELPKHVGKNTFVFLQKEIERYQRVLDFIKNNRYKEHMEGEIKDLVTLREGDYWLEADKNSRFSLASYQLDEDVYVYDFAIDFRGGKDYHTRDMILTSADIGPIWKNIFRFDEEYKKEVYCRTLDIYNTRMEKEIVKKRSKIITSHISFMERTPQILGFLKRAINKRLLIIIVMEEKFVWQH